MQDSLAATVVKQLASKARRSVTAGSTFLIDYACTTAGTPDALTYQASISSGGTLMGRL
jgi:hypothetical protein